MRTLVKEHRKQQLQERLRAGGQWVENGLVFTTYASYGHAESSTADAQRMRASRKMTRSASAQPLQAGKPLQPRNVLRTLHALLKSAKLPVVRFHDLRHSAASLLIAAGVELVEVSMLLGYSELRVTADLYSHLQQQTAAKAARHMDAVFSS
jgi:site-specific recombinase XerD